MANKVTLKQIAQEVGLSPSSVSLVLNNRRWALSSLTSRAAFLPRSPVAWKSAAARTAMRSSLPARAEAPMTIWSCCASW